MVAIETKNLTKKFKEVVAVDNLNLTVNEGEIFSLLGVNGAGKTTTIKMLTCLLAPTSGDALLFGKSILNQSQDIKKIINVSPQETAVAPNLSVKENLEFIAGIYGIKKELIPVKVNEMINSFGLNSVAKKE